MGDELLLSDCALPAKILMVEDNPDDVALNLLCLKKAHWDVQVEVVRTREEFVHQLHAHYFDVILSDYALGDWTGLDAFELMRREGRNIPFILVTGALGDEKAVECIRKGMTDYILKGHLERLSVAISRALEEKALTREHQMAEAALRENEAKFRMLADALPAAVFIEQRTVCRYVNRAAEKITGYPKDQLMKMNFWQLVVPKCRRSISQRATIAQDSITLSHQLAIRDREGNTRWLDVTVGMFQVEGSLASLITAFDITGRRKAEEELQNPVRSREALVRLYA